MNHSNLFAQRKAEPYFLFYGKADVLMGLCAPAVVATHAALEGSTAACGIIRLEVVEAFFFFFFEEKGHIHKYVSLSSNFYYFTNSFTFAALPTRSLK